MKKRLLIIGLLVIIVFVIGTFVINIYMISDTKDNIYDFNNINELNTDAILILGCKAYSDHPSKMLELRLEKGIEMYQKFHKKIIISGDHSKNDYDEVNVMRDYLLSYGVSKEDIFLDHAGLNTYDSIYRAKYIFGVKRIAIVTQEYHLYRALFIAKELGIDAIGIKADDLLNQSIMLKNKIREVFSRDKNFFKALIKPESKYLGDPISLDDNSLVTEG